MSDHLDRLVEQFPGQRGAVRRYPVRLTSELVGEKDAEMLFPYNAAAVADSRRNPTRMRGGGAAPETVRVIVFRGSSVS